MLSFLVTYSSLSLDRFVWLCCWLVWGLRAGYPALYGLLFDMSGNGVRSLELS